MNSCKAIIKKCLNGIQKTFNSILWVCIALFRQGFKNRIKSENREKNLVILAGGPSLKNDIENIDFNSSDISVVNAFFQSPWFKRLKPHYYVVADPVFFRREENLSPIIRDVDWDMVLLVPTIAWKNMKNLHSVPNKNITILPYNSLPYNGFECIKYKLYENGLSMPKVQNVLVASIFTGINLGYKEIRLYGVDHSWTKTLGVNSQNEVCAVDDHFYDKNESTFSPYWKDPETKEMFKMHELLRAFAQMFESYHVLRGYADYKGVRIVNCTKESFIDAFERA